MKLRKCLKSMGIMLSTCMALTCLSTVPVSASNLKEEAVIDYAHLLESYMSYTPGTFYFGLIYMNDDEIPELYIAIDGSHVSSPIFYTWYDGYTCDIDIASSFGSFAFVPKGNWVRGSYEGMGGSVIDFYSLKDGAIDLEERYGKEQTYDSNGNEVISYCCNDNSLTEYGYTSYLSMANDYDFAIVDYGCGFEVTASNISDMKSHPDSYIVGANRTVINCSSWISLRTEPNVNASTVCTIPKGKSVYYLGEAKNGFCRVSYNSQFGYALKDYLTGSGSSNTTSIKEMTVVNCQKDVTLRSMPDVNAGMITMVPFGATVNYMGSASNGFYYVEYDGYKGYILSQYLK